VVSALDMIGPLTADAIPEYQFLILGMTWIIYVFLYLVSSIFSC
jgi:hypothetical protein